MSFLIENLESRQMLAATPHVVPSATLLAYSQVKGTLSAAQSISFKNTGSGKLVIQSINLIGNDAPAFVISNLPKKFSLAKNKSLSFMVKFMAFDVSLRGAVLRVTTNDPVNPIQDVQLRGIGAQGQYEVGEPSLARILSALQIDANVGDADPSTTTIDTPLSPNDEVPAQLLQKAGTGPVTIKSLASYSYNTDPVSTVGWYSYSPTLNARALYTTPIGFGQNLLPKAIGNLSFDPGNAAFGIFSNWPSQVHGATYSEDTYNYWNTKNANKHSVRFYKYRDASGNIVPNSYVAAFEESLNDDFNDTVLLISNVKPNGT